MAVPRKENARAAYASHSGNYFAVAVEDLSQALEEIAPMGLGRAEAGLHTDLALAYSAHGDLTQARRQARRAAGFAERSGSVRQRARLARLLRPPDPVRGKEVE